MVLSHVTLVNLEGPRWNLIKYRVPINPLRFSWLLFGAQEIHNYLIHQSALCNDTVSSA